MYFCSHLQIFGRNVIACAENVGFSGCFNTSPCFPNSLVVGLAMELRAQRAQNPSEKHVACFKSPGFLCACDPLKEVLKSVVFSFILPRQGQESPQKASLTFK